MQLIIQRVMSKLFYANNKTTTINPRIKPFGHQMEFLIPSYEKKFILLIYTDKQIQKYIPIYGKVIIMQDTNCSFGFGCN
jgi:hypothetical protein